jgi:UDP-glucuronate 4-epimerase
MAILVTGAAGFIGSHVVKMLTDSGQSVVGLDNFNPYYDPALKEARVSQFLGASGMVMERVDLTDFAAVRDVFARHQITAICHLAAQAGVRYSITHPLVYGQTNVVGTLHLLEAAKEFGVKQFVFASTSSVYGLEANFPSREDQPATQPISLYSATKRAGELMLHSYHHLHGIQGTVLRFFNVYGPWGRPDMALFIFTQKMLAGERLPVFNYGKSDKDYTYVEDIAAGIVAALAKPFEFEIINLGNGRPVPLLQYIDLIAKELNITPDLDLLPPQAGDVERSCADITKAKTLLGYAPSTPVGQGVKNFVAWYKEYYRV